MTTSGKQFDQTQRKVLLGHARDVITGFALGAIHEDDPNPHAWGENGWTLFDGYAVRHTDEYLKAQREFTRLAAKMLKARSAHEQTIRTLCQKAAQEYVKLTAAGTTIDVPSPLDAAAKGLVETVLAEAGRAYVHIQPNFLVRHAAMDIVTLGRVRSMRTELAAANTILSKNPGITLAVGNYPDQTFHPNGSTLFMPGSIWVVDVPATMENVAEEAKWLIDVAISLMRLSSQEWRGLFPSTGELEAHPTYPTITAQPHVTMEGDKANTGGVKLPGYYEIDAEIVTALSAPEVQSRAAVLFDPSDKSLAQRVAQGLGWLTRGRQVSDRAERLLSFFTALEALLTSNDKSDPVTQTISRHVSVICTQDIKGRITAYDRIKALYALRSAVVHAGRREVLWQDVNILQTYVETVFWHVLNRCDLTMPQDRFAQSLADASHGLRWEFAKPEEPPDTSGG